MTPKALEQAIEGLTKYLKTEPSERDKLIFEVVAIRDSLQDIAGRQSREQEEIISMIAKEVDEQLTREGWTPEHDKQHTRGELAKAAACYAVEHTDARVTEMGENAWPWEEKWWKPKDTIRNLVRAAALIVAEIRRQLPSQPIVRGKG